jgi:phosphopantetheinyl transferase
MRSHVELGDGRGGVWARLAGWADFIMPVSGRYLHSTDAPHRFAWSEELSLPGAPPGSVCTLLTREDFKGVNLEWTARLFLHARELAEYETLASAARRREFLAARAAAKDAARLWWSRRHGTNELPHPSTLVISHDAAGRPYLELGDDLDLPLLSIAHTEGCAVALAADVAIGIDIEPATRDTRAILPSFATAEERALIDELDGAYPDSAYPDGAYPDGATPTKLWCAKEAVAKALGTGLQGRPKDFEALAIEGNGDFLIQHGPTGDRWVAHAVQAGPFIVAWTSAAETGVGLVSEREAACP